MRTVCLARQALREPDGTGSDRAGHPACAPGTTARQLSRDAVALCKMPPQCAQPFDFARAARSLSMLARNASNRLLSMISLIIWEPMGMR